MRPIVVKLGGSLASSAELEQWLAAIGAGNGRTVLVPGGGPFADQVRSLQQRAGFDDSVAHRMALLAMEQYGLMLCGLAAGLVPAGSMTSLRAALQADEVPVWMPSTMVLADLSIPQSWEVTSDSLSAWLATRLGASTLVLVKSMTIAEPLPTAEVLAARGWVDRGFPQFAAAVQLRWLGPGQSAELRTLLAGTASLSG